ncbi:putative pectinesterase/pectinesterase inhibitor 38 [Lycium ferocissimum]|uniref:putative pectinesterase/pectinesterase inhibitor 38 n=1 Tax=Lycium ferocissimum TaxID=112874 RepID=UPI0028158E5E|nr:putative pectinesterase/pectinesterase inhibitor 38 [Lycium ferocissimum]
MEGKEVGIFTVMLLLWWSVGSCVIFDSTVAKDGSGNYKTITEALHAAPKQSKKSYFIHVKAGVYHENVTVPTDKTNIALVGDGMGVTIIAASKSEKKGFATPNTATLEVYGSGFIGMKMTIRNTARAIGGQAAALTSATYFNGFASYYQCSFEGFQDTIFAQIGSAFFRECKVYGTIDFICGDGKAIFQNSAIYARTPLPGQGIRMLAPGSDNFTQNPGLVLQNCTISPAADFKKSSVRSFLGWPWKNQGKGVIMSSYINDFIDPQGWTPNPNVKIIYFAEYNNRGPGSGTKGRVKWSKIIDKTEAFKFTVRNFMHGDKWIPNIIPHYLDL